MPVHRVVVGAGGPPAGEVLTLLAGLIARGVLVEDDPAAGTDPGGPVR